MPAQTTPEEKGTEKSGQEPVEKTPAAQEDAPVETKPKKKDLPIGAVIAVLIVAIGLIGWIGYATMLAPPPLSPEQRAKNEFMDQMARKSGGDPTKLSKEEMARMDALTRGFGKVTLKDIAENKGYKK